MASAGDIVANLKLKVDNFNSGIENAGRKASEFGDNFQRTADSMKNVGAGMAASGAVVAAGLGGAVKTAADFESSMSRVGALSGATGKEMQSMTNKAKELGASTAYSATEASQGMQALSMAGFSAQETVSSMGDVLNMAAAGQIELGKAADITSNVLSGFGMSADQAGRASDVLAKTSTSSNTTIAGLGNTMKQVAPIADSVGWSLESMSAAAGKMGDAGIDASQAGTMLRSAVTRLSAPTKAAQKEMDKYGISVKNADGSMKTLPEILQQMKTGFKGVDSTTRAAAMSTIFGQEAMSGMMKLMSDPQGLKTYTQELKNAEGTGKRIANQQMNNLNGAVRKLGSAFEGASIAIGSALVPAITRVAKWLQSMLQWFNGLSTSTQNFIAIGTALASVLAMVSGAGLVVVGFLPQLIAGFKSLALVASTLRAAIAVLSVSLKGLMFNPIVLGITAVVAAIALLVTKGDVMKAKLAEWGITMELFRKYINKAKSAIVSLWNNFTNTAVFAVMSEMIMNLVQRFKDLYNAIKTAVTSGDFTPLFEAVKNLIPMILSILMGGIPRLIMMGAQLIQGLTQGTNQSMPQLIQKAGQAITQFIQRILTKIPQLMQTGMKFIKSLVSGLTAAMPQFMASVTQIMNQFVNMITSLLPKLIQQGMQMLKSLMNGLMQAMPQITSTVTTLITTIVNMITTLLPQILNVGIKLLTTLIQGISQILPQLTTTALNVINTLVTNLTSMLPKLLQAGIQILNTVISGITQMLPQLISAGVQILTSLLNGITNALPQLMSTATTIITKLVTTLTTLLPKLIEIGIQVLTTLIDGITQMLPQLVSAALNIVTSLLNALVSNLPKLVNAGIKILNAVIDGIIQLLPQIIQTAVQVLDTIIQTVVSNLPMIIEAGIKILNSLIDGITQLLPQLISAAVDLIVSIVEALTGALPQIIEAGVQILTALIEGILQILPQLVSAAIDLIIAIVDALIGALPQIIEAGVQLVLALIDGIIQILPQLVSAAIELVTALLEAILQALPEILNAGVKLIGALIEGVLSLIGEVGSAAWDIATKIFDTISDMDLVDVGKDLIRGLWNGIGSMTNWVKRKISGFSESVLDGIKGFFDINSPSKVFDREVGQNLVRGMNAGIQRLAKMPQGTMKRVAENVIGGVDAVKNAFSSMGGMTVSAPNVGNMQMTGARLNDLSERKGEDGNGGDSYNAPLVNVDRMEVRDEQDTRKISKELYNMQRNRNRAKGGR
ncbi:phage tail tape measure protein [Marinococcus halophilus]|uniref:Phage tail tape measure protein domain-containing protein n=1 Tax=Marinococcus halophilus TaxID=1371 RepID=A0A510Y3F9_MARHA|nr:phage tail tape measure protein [Marinococcus halophilus]OZT81194.1 phage tail tape measure protein [Marinococcus halophilus]GEK57127.1 hypothetical protein MHA01_00320 [Marinococcus halophilus]